MMTPSPTITIMTILEQHPSATPSGSTLPIQTLFTSDRSDKGLGRLIASGYEKVRSFFKSARVEESQPSDEEKIITSFAEKHSTIFMS